MHFVNKNCSIFNKKAENICQFNKRMKIFANHTIHVLNHNMKYKQGNVTYQVRINHLSNLVGNNLLQLGWERNEIWFACIDDMSLAWAWTCWLTRRGRSIAHPTKLFVLNWRRRSQQEQATHDQRGVCGQRVQYKQSSVQVRSALHAVHRFAYWQKQHKCRWVEDDLLLLLLLLNSNI